VIAVRGAGPRTLTRKEVRYMEIAHWKGSEKTAAIVKEEIANRWGEEEAENYDPRNNCFTFKTWRTKGYHVKKGEKAIRSMTFKEVKDEDTKEVKQYPKTVYLFYIKQVEK
jgi:N-terminal domain of anti-restriction factor ArdC